MLSPNGRYEFHEAVLEGIPNKQEGGVRGTWKMTQPLRDGGGVTYTSSHDSAFAAVATDCKSFHHLMIRLAALKSNCGVTLDDLIRADEPASIEVIRKIYIQVLLDFSEKMIGNRDFETSPSTCEVHLNIEALRALQGMLSVEFPMWHSIQELIELFRVVQEKFSARE